MLFAPPRVASPDAVLEASRRAPREFEAILGGSAVRALAP